MTTEEKAKAYDNIIQRVTELYETGTCLTMEQMEYLFPELRESEDERIKKELIEFIKWSVDRHFMREDFHQSKRPSEWIAYLEKQKEYHIPWYDYQKSKEAGYTIVPNEEYEQLIKQKEQKPAWSEEDEEMRNLIIAIFEVNHPNGFFKANELGTTDMHGVHTEEIISWLKSLRPQPHWKPSEEQMRALRDVITMKRAINKFAETRLREIYEQLQKQM